MTAAFRWIPKLFSSRRKPSGRSTSYADTYQSGQPYHHICIDDFLPMGVVKKVRADLAGLPEAVNNRVRHVPNDTIGQHLVSLARLTVAMSLHLGRSGCVFPCDKCSCP